MIGRRTRTKTLNLLPLALFKLFHIVVVNGAQPVGAKMVMILDEHIDAVQKEQYMYTIEADNLKLRPHKSPPLEVFPWKEEKCREGGLTRRGDT